MPYSNIDTQCFLHVSVIQYWDHCRSYTCQISSPKALWQIPAQSSLSSYKSYYQVIIGQFTILYNFSSFYFIGAPQTQTVTKNQGSHCKHWKQIQWNSSIIRLSQQRIQSRMKNYGPFWRSFLISHGEKQQWQ